MFNALLAKSRTRKAELFSSLHSRKATLSSLAIVFVLAVAVRAGYIWCLSPSFAEWPDSRHIERIAWRLASEQGYDDASENPPAIYRAPLTPYLISGVYRVLGHRPLAAQYLMAFLGALGVVALCYSATHLFGQRAGILSAIVAALYPYFVYLTGVFYPETIGVPLVSACAAFFVMNVGRTEMRALGMGVLGGMVGFCALCRPNWLLTMPLVIAAVPVCRWWRGRSNSPRLVALAFLCWLACWTPWTIRNALVYHGLVPITASGGYNFYLGNAPDATWDSKTSVSKPTLPPMLGSVEQDGHWYRLGWERVRDRPARALWLWMGRLLAEWQPFPLIKDHAVASGNILIASTTYGCLLAVALVGAARCARLRSREILALLLVALVDTCLCAVFIAPGRLRIPFDGLLILAAASLSSSDAPHQALRLMQAAMRPFRSLMAREIGPRMDRNIAKPPSSREAPKPRLELRSFLSPQAVPQPIYCEDS